MGRVMVLVLAALLAVNYAVSQQGPDFAGIDKRTYELYLDSSWKELLSAGEEAINQGIDYYYLRMRLGIAAFETEDYSKAIRHFRKALEFNSADDVAKEYLYFAFMFYGREMEAHKVAQSFSRELRRKYSYAVRSAVRSFSLSTTAGFIHDTEITDRYSADNLPDIDGSQAITRNYVHFGAGLEHEAGNRLRITHAAGYFSKNYLYFSREPGEDRLISDAKVNQFQYYLSGRLLLGNGIFLVPAVHYLNVQIPSEALVVGRGRFSFVQQQVVTRHDVASSLGVEKYAGKIRSGFSAGYSYINEQEQLRGTFSFAWFPFGNLNLYSASEITRYTVMPADSHDGTFIFSHTIGFRTFPGLWLELWGQLGKIENYAGPGAYLVFNDTGSTRGQFGISILAPFVSERFETALHYNYSIRESRFVPDDPAADITTCKNNTNYNNITAVIRWKF